MTTVAFSNDGKLLVSDELDHLKQTHHAAKLEDLFLEYMKDGRHDR